MIHETIDRLRVEVKRDQLEKQFEELTWQLQELEKKMQKMRADATAVNGAIQVCQQLLDEGAKDEEIPEEVLPQRNKSEDVAEEKQQDPRFVID